MIILGIDPGVAHTGFGIVKRTGSELECLDYGVIITNPKEKAEYRLNKIFIEVSKLLKKHSPEMMAVEKLFFFKNLKTAMPVSEARGVVLLAGAKKKIKIQELTPLQVKMGVCGYGRAEKKQVQKMIKEILNLDEIPKSDDAADALGVAVCCSYLNRG